MLRVTNGSELTSEDDKLEPKIDKTSSKKRKPCSSISVESDEEKLKKKSTREDGKACRTDPSDEETLKKNPAKKHALKIRSNSFHAKDLKWSVCSSSGSTKSSIENIRRTIVSQRTT